MLMRFSLCLVWLLCALNVLGQSDSIRKSSGQQTIPASQTATVSGSGKASAPASSTVPTTNVAEESDLERQLNRRYSRPNRLGPSPSRPESISPKLAKPARKDTTSTRQVRSIPVKRDSSKVKLPAKQPPATTAASSATVTPTQSQTVVPVKTGTPPATVPVQAKPQSATVTPAQSRTVAAPTSTTNPATTPVQKRPQSTAKPSSATVTPTSSRTVTPAKAGPIPAQGSAPVQAKPLPQEQGKGGIPPATVPAQRVPDAPSGAPSGNSPAMTTPAGNPASGSAPTSTTARSTTATSATTAAPASLTATQKRVLRPGIVSPNIVQPQSRTTINSDTLRVAAKDSVSADSANSADAFKTTVKYLARDSTIYAADGQTVELFGDASVIYGDISLKADYIRLNYLTNEVYARGRFDSTQNKLIGRPVFQDGEGKYDSKEIRYNFKSKKGKIQGVITQQGEGNIRGQNVKKDDEDNLYIGKAIYTTCNLATPHFHINASKLKVIHNKQVVAGPFNLVINQIPLPLGLPFGFFPFPKRKEIGVSGILMPQYGEEPNGRGYYLRDGGYYWAVNENLGLQFKGQIYSRGSWGVGLSSAYNKRYTYSGGVNLQFARNRTGDPVDITQAPRNDFSFTWSHTPVPRGRGSFSANVNISSNSYNQTNAYTGTNAYISNVAGSSVQYSRTLGQYARFGANVRVNQQFGQLDPITNRRVNGKTDVSSDFNFGLNQIAPFALRGGSGRWYESFRFGLDVSGSITVNNTIRTQVDTSGLGFPVITRLAATNPVKRAQDSADRAIALRTGQVLQDPTLILFNRDNLGRLWENRLVQARYSIPITLPNLKILKYINVTPGFSLQGNIYTKKLNYVYVPGRGGAVDSVRADTSRGLFPSYNFAVNASMNTRFYGTYFIRGKRIEAIRHTVAPSISFSYVPDFTNPAFGQFQIIQGPEGSQINNVALYRRTLSVFRGLNGTGSSGTSTQAAFVSFGIVNQLEMKVRTRNDSTGNDFKKVPIFDNISLNGSYNFLAPEYKLSPITVSANTQIFKNISFNFSSTFDPYAQVAYSGTPVYNLTAYDLSSTLTPSPLTYSPAILRVVDYTNQQYARVNRFAYTEGQGLARLTNLQAYVSARFAPKQSQKPKTSNNASDATMKAINNNPELYVDFNIPWSFNVSYTYGLSKLTPEVSQVIQALTLTGDLSLTPKWKITISTGYDFNFKSPTLTTIGINRDLHCWEMAFNWTPYSGSNIRSGNYSFDLRARSSILQELKLSRRRSFYDTGGFYGR
jgi:lipopolysaccharide export system protein LptA